MKRVGKALMIAGAMFLAGIILSAVGAGIVVKHRQTADADSKNWTMQTYQADGAEIACIIIDVTFENIQVEPTDGTEIELIWYDDSAEPVYTVTQNGDSLRLQKSLSQGFHISDLEELLNLGTLEEDEYKNQNIVVRIPDCYMGGYRLDSASGDVTIADVPAEQAILIDTASGDIRIEGIDCQSFVSVDSASGILDIIDSVAADGITSGSTSGNVNFMNVGTQADIIVSTTSGSMSFHTVQAGGDMKVSSTSGDVHVEDLTVSGILEFDATSGYMMGSTLSVDELDTETTSGDVKLQQVTLGTGIKGSSTSGCYSISLTDTMEEYGIQTDTTSGYVNLPNGYHLELERYIDISTTSGDIQFEFAE